MRILKEIFVKSTCATSCVVLLLMVGARMAYADDISDTLTVADSLGFSMTMQLSESNEPFGKLTITYPGGVFDLTNAGGTQLSDILSISPFTVTLTSDDDSSGGGEIPEAGITIPITITAVSDQNTSSGISDTLTVTGHPAVSILESAEPFDVVIPVAAMSVPFGNGGDAIAISAFTADLVSLNDAPGADFGTMTDTITITGTSDSVPEPSTLTLLGLGLAIAGMIVANRSLIPGGRL